MTTTSKMLKNKMDGHANSEMSLKINPQQNITKYLRGRKMSTIEQDLVQQAELFLDELFQGRLTEQERLALQNWLSNQLEAERQGWKKKIALGLKEVEKERKQALEVHNYIHEMNNKFEPLFSSIFMFREPSMYHSTEKDMKTNHIEELGKNLDAVLAMAQRIKDEREELFTVLKLEHNDSLVDAIDMKWKILEERATAAETERVDTEERLNKEIQILSDTIDLQENMTKERLSKGDDELITLRKKVIELKSKLHAYSGLITFDNCTQTESQRPIPKATLCVQTGMTMENISDIENQLESKKLKLERMEYNEVVMEQQNEDPSSSRSDLDMHTPITAITIVKQPSRESDYKSTMSSKLSSESLQRMLLHDDIGEMTKYLESRRRKENCGEDGTVEYLRIKVQDYAHKLEEAKKETEVYQRQIALLRHARLFGKDSIYQGIKDNVPPNTADIPNGTHDPQERNVLQNLKNTDNKRWSSEGVLTGSKVKPNASDDTVAHRYKMPQRSTELGVYKMTTAKCLRCNKVYRVKENHKHACRFHPKKRQKIEKYDSNGKLLRIVHVWECCMQKPDAPGCSISEHV